MSELEAIADAAEAAVFAQHHKDLCGCDRWPDSCPHFPKERTLFSVNAYDVVMAAAPLIEKAAMRRVLGSEDDPTGILDRYTVACASNEPGKPLFFWYCGRCNTVHVTARDLDGDQSGVTLAEMAESAIAHEREAHGGEVA